MEERTRGCQINRHPEVRAKRASKDAIARAVDPSRFAASPLTPQDDGLGTAKREKEKKNSVRKTKHNPLEAYQRECSDIAVMLEQDSQEALDRATPRGRAAMESAFTEMKKRAVFARFFAFEAKLHRVCPNRVCKRARYCKGLSLFCTRGRVLDRDEEIYARGRFYAFIRIMRAPETEEEQRLNGKTPSGIRAGGGNPFNASRNARESNPTRGLSRANQIQ